MNKPLTPRVDYGSEEAAMQAYLRDGEQRAAGARQSRADPLHRRRASSIPTSSTPIGAAASTSSRACSKADELADIERDVHDILDRLPAERGAALDAKGRPALAADCKGPNLLWAKPLGDPFGGTELANGRHPVKMYEPKAAADAPKEVVYLILGSLQFSEAALRVYGHPELLAVAAAINGAGLRAVQRGAVHQGAGPRRLGRLAPGRRHALGQPRLGPGHPRLQLHGPALRLHRGQRRVGRAGLAQARQGRHQGSWSPRPAPSGCPTPCRSSAQPGDVAITNRQALHGSFANTSKDWRVTLNMGFHRRRSVLGVKGGGVHNEDAVYDAERIRERARLIGYGIDARRQRFPDETPYRLQAARRRRARPIAGTTRPRPRSRTTTCSTSASRSLRGR